MATTARRDEVISGQAVPGGYGNVPRGVQKGTMGVLKCTRLFMKYTRGVILGTRRVQEGYLRVPGIPLSPRPVHPRVSFPFRLLQRFHPV